jgi:hypothetical protein
VFTPSLVRMGFFDEGEVRTVDERHRVEEEKPVGHVGRG